MRIKTGYTRIVIIIGRIAVKLPRWNNFKEGIMCNQNEYKFYCENKLSFLMPTYISFFGLINIQEAGEETKLKTMDLWCHLSEITDGAVWCDSHLFVNPENFGIKNGHLCILDYGNSETHDMLKKFSDKIYNEFDFLYSWDEEKQQAYTNKG